MSIDHANYPGLPKDFPISTTPSALSGIQPKMSLVEEDGRFFAPGTCPSEVLAVFHMCEDLVVQMVPYCQRKLATFGCNQEVTVEASLKGLLKKRWCSEAQCVWIMRRVTRELQWTVREDVFSF